MAKLERRDEIARIIETVAKDGLPGSRDLDVAIDAVFEALGLEPTGEHRAVKFKSYVHDRLDEAGIPAHPGGPHSENGCRIGDRLDVALAVIPAAKKILRTLNYHIQASPVDALPVFTGIAELHDAVTALEKKND